MGAANAFGIRQYIVFVHDMIRSASPKLDALPPVALLTGYMRSCLSLCSPWLDVLPGGSAEALLVITLRSKPCSQAGQASTGLHPEHNIIFTGSTRNGGWQAQLRRRPLDSYKPASKAPRPYLQPVKGRQHASANQAVPLRLQQGPALSTSRTAHFLRRLPPQTHSVSRARHDSAAEAQAADS